MSAFWGAFPPKSAKFSINFDFTFRPGLKHFWKLLESLVWLVRDSPIILAFIKLYKLCRFSKWPLLLISLFLISTKIDYFSGESKQLADPDVLKRLTSSVRFVSFSQVWTSTAVVLSVKCPHKISYRRHFYLQFWDNNWCPSSTYWLFPENLAQLSCFFFVWHKGLAALPWTRQRRLWPACAPSLLCNSLTPAGKQTINKQNKWKPLLEWLTSFCCGSESTGEFQVSGGRVQPRGHWTSETPVGRGSQGVFRLRCIITTFGYHLFCSTCKQL